MFERGPVNSICLLTLRFEITLCSGEKKKDDSCGRFNIT